MDQSLGWMTLQLNVGDLSQALRFYTALDFVVAYGGVEDGWAVLAHPCGELELVQRKAGGDLIKLHGGDLPAIVAAAADNGLSPAVAPVRISDDAWSATFADPDGLQLGFHTDDDSARRLRAGERFSLPDIEQKLKAGALYLGLFCYCAMCSDLERSVDFYLDLGFEYGDGEPSEGWALVINGEVPDEPEQLAGSLQLILMEGHFPENVLGFRGADTRAVARALRQAGFTLDQEPFIDAAGTRTLMVNDPDGRLLHLTGEPG